MAGDQLPSYHPNVHVARDGDVATVTLDRPESRNGCTGDMLLRDANDPNDILVLTFWPTAADAQAFATDPRLPEVMLKAGVTGEPRIEIYEETNS